MVKQIDGKKCEPYESLVVDVPQEFSGRVIDLVTQRKGELIVMETKDEMQHLEFEIPSRIDRVEKQYAHQYSRGSRNGSPLY